MKKTNSFAFQGVNGAYSEQAGKNVFPDCNSVPCSTFEEMFSFKKVFFIQKRLVSFKNIFHWLRVLRRLPGFIVKV